MQIQKKGSALKRVGEGHKREKQRKDDKKGRKGGIVEKKGGFGLPLQHQNKGDTIFPEPTFQESKIRNKNKGANPTRKKRRPLPTLEKQLFTSIP